MTRVVCDRAHVDQMLAIARRAQLRAGWLHDGTLASLDVSEALDELVTGLAALLGVDPQPRLADTGGEVDPGEVGVGEPDPSQLTDPLTVITPAQWSRIDAAVGSDDEPTLILRRPVKRPSLETER